MVCEVMVGTISTMLLDYEMESISESNGTFQEISKPKKRATHDNKQECEAKDVAVEVVEWRIFDFNGECSRQLFHVESGRAFG